ncbi:MAG TPA: S24 family peptidase [Rubrobacteraceae bacterium]|jgi:hypothetical protein|nr:S24 family peptidase [Rubrobacteraceae bacterium]
MVAGVRISRWEAAGRTALMGRIAAGRGLEAAALLRDGEEVTVKRLYEDGEKVRTRPENGDLHEELALPAEEVRVQGRVVYVVHPPGKKRTAGGGA